MCTNCLSVTVTHCRFTLPTPVCDSLLHRQLNSMSSSAASRSPAERLVTACYKGDLSSAKAAVADGASVNEEGWVPGWGSVWLPLASAVFWKHHDAVVWLLSHGADPNGVGIMVNCVVNSSAAILQLLIDAGGDVNRESVGQPPLFAAMLGFSEDKVRMLLAQPSTDFTITNDDSETPEQWARDQGKPALADTIAQEVSGNCRNPGFRFLY